VEAWLSEPVVQTAVLPFAVAAGAAVLLRAVGRGRGTALAGLAVAAGFVAAYLAILGPPPFPPVSASHKIAYIVVAAAAIGLVLDLAAVHTLISRLVLIVAGVAAGAWLIGAQLDLADRASLIWPAAPVAAGWLVVLWRLETARRNGATAPVMLAVAAAAAAAVALLGRSASIAQLCGGLAAAAAGYALLPWLAPRSGCGRAATAAGGAAFLALATVMVAFTAVTPWALLVLLAAFLAERRGRRFAAVVLPATGVVRRLLEPVPVAFAAALPAAAAVALAWLLSSGGTPY
jgi:hypothetical protein